VREDFVFVDEVVSGIRWDAKYATWDNFTGRPVDGYEVNRIVGSQALVHEEPEEPPERGGPASDGRGG